MSRIICNGQQRPLYTERLLSRGIKGFPGTKPKSWPGELFQESGASLLQEQKQALARAKDAARAKPAAKAAAAKAVAKLRNKSKLQLLKTIPFLSHGKVENNVDLFRPPLQVLRPRSAQCGFPYTNQICFECRLSHSCEKSLGIHRSILLS